MGWVSRKKEATVLPKVKSERSCGPKFSNGQTGKGFTGASMSCTFFCKYRTPSLHQSKKELQVRGISSSSATQNPRTGGKLNRRNPSGSSLKGRRMGIPSFNLNKRNPICSKAVSVSEPVRFISRTDSGNRNRLSGAGRIRVSSIRNYPRSRLISSERDVSTGSSLAHRVDGWTSLASVHRGGDDGDDDDDDDDDEDDDGDAVAEMFLPEVSVFLRGSMFSDRHRDMRMDIDDMSYEELLELGERMGTVSTALSDDSFSSSVQRRPFFFSQVHKEHDVQCSICQEEYVEREEVGELKCVHKFHLRCIKQWLQMKNWCPICKTSLSIHH